MLESSNEGTLSKETETPVVGFLSYLLVSDGMTYACIHTLGKVHRFQIMGPLPNYIQRTRGAFRNYVACRLSLPVALTVIVGSSSLGKRIAGSMSRQRGSL